MQLYHFIKKKHNVKQNHFTEKTLNTQNNNKQALSTITSTLHACMATQRTKCDQ